MNETNNTQDFFASEMLADLKAEKERVYKLLEKKEHHQLIERVIAFATILIIIGGFLWYMYQYDYVSYEEHSADGVYAVVDSEGNVIAADLDEEVLNQLMEGSYGEGESDQDESSEAQVQE